MKRWLFCFPHFLFAASCEMMLFFFVWWKSPLSSKHHVLLEKSERTTSIRQNMFRFDFGSNPCNFVPMCICIFELRTPMPLNIVTKTSDHTSVALLVCAFSFGRNSTKCIHFVPANPFAAAYDLYVCNKLHIFLFKQRPIFFRCLFVCISRRSYWL